MTASTTASVSAPSPETVNSSDFPSSSHSEIQKGVAIGVAVGVISVIITLLCAWLIRRQRRTLSSARVNALNPVANKSDIAELSAEQQVSEVPNNYTAAIEMEA